MSKLRASQLKVGDRVQCIGIFDVNATVTSITIDEDGDSHVQFMPKGEWMFKPDQQFDEAIWELAPDTPFTVAEMAEIADWFISDEKDAHLRRFREGQELYTNGHQPPPGWYFDQTLGYRLAMWRATGKDLK